MVCRTAVYRSLPRQLGKRGPSSPSRLHQRTGRQIALPRPLGRLLLLHHRPQPLGPGLVPRLPPLHLVGLVPVGFLLGLGSTELVRVLQLDLGNNTLVPVALAVRGTTSQRLSSPPTPALP